MCFPPSGADRRFYELCVLAELRDRLRAWDIWVTFETYLIPAATFKAMQKEPLPLDIDTDLSSYLAECRQSRSMDEYGDPFVHLRTQAPPKNRQALLTAVLADGILISG